MAKNGGQQLVLLVKGGVSDAQRQRLGYSHVHSSRAADAAAGSSCSGTGTAADGEPEAGFCPAAGVGGSCSTAAARVPALLCEVVRSVDAVVHQKDVSIIHKVAAFRARQAAATAVQDSAAAAASSASGSPQLSSLATLLRMGLSQKALQASPRRSLVHTVCCYTTNQSRLRPEPADEDAGDSDGGDGAGAAAGADPEAGTVAGAAGTEAGTEGEAGGDGSAALQPEAATNGQSNSDQKGGSLIAPTQLTSNQTISLPGRPSHWADSACTWLLQQPLFVSYSGVKHHCSAIVFTHAAQKPAAASSHVTRPLAQRRRLCPDTKLSRPTAHSASAALGLLLASTRATSGCWVRRRHMQVGHHQRDMLGVTAGFGGCTVCLELCWGSLPG